MFHLNFPFFEHSRFAVLFISRNNYTYEYVSSIILYVQSIHTYTVFPMTAASVFFRFVKLTRSYTSSFFFISEHQPTVGIITMLSTPVPQCRDAMKYLHIADMFTFFCKYFVNYTMKYLSTIHAGKCTLYWRGQTYTNKLVRECLIQLRIGFVEKMQQHEHAVSVTAISLHTWCYR